MPTSTPNYVLIEGDQPTGPRVACLEATPACSVLYGFSDKTHYDTFCQNSQQALRPYPLVKGYLRHRIEASGDSLKLVVLDAYSPTEPYLRATTMEAALESQENHDAHVTAAYRLTFDEGAKAYRVDRT